MVVEFFNEHKAAIFIAIAVLLVIEAIVMFFIARNYRKKLNINVYNGGIACFFGISLIGFGILCIIENNMLGVPMILIGVIIMSFMYYRNFKKYGKTDGIKISIIQTLLCVGCLFEVAELSAFKKNQYNQQNSNYYQGVQNRDNNINK